MSAAGRAWQEWLDAWLEDGGSVASIHQDDLQQAYVDGWSGAMNARWETSPVPMLGIAGGEDLGPAHPGAPRED